MSKSIEACSWFLNLYLNREVSSPDQPRQFIGNWGDAKNGQIVEPSNNWTIDGLSIGKYYQFSVSL